MGQYIIDSNIFISSARVHYPFDIMPRFWEGLLNVCKNHKLILVDEVYHELIKNEDELSLWIKENKSSFISMSLNQDSLTHYAHIMNLVKNEKIKTSKGNEFRYTLSAITDFMDVNTADAFIVAYAMTDSDITVVTDEVYAEGIRKNVKIPNLCKMTKVRYINKIEFFREIHFSL